MLFLIQYFSVSNFVATVLEGLFPVSTWQCPLHAQTKVRLKYKKKIKATGSVERALIPQRPLGKATVGLKSCSSNEHCEQHDSFVKMIQ